MDFIGNLLAVIVIAIFISAAFYYALKARGPWGSFWTFFLILLLIIWATSLWVRPIGPVFYGVSWVPLFVAGIIFAILLAAIPSSHPHRRTNMYDRNTHKGIEFDSEGREKADSTNRSLAVISGVFWILIIILLIAIIFGYMV